MSGRKRFWAALLAVIFILAFPASALAGTSLADLTGTYDRVYDLADLLSDEEEQAVSDQILVLKDKMQMDLAVVTTEDTYGYSLQNFADQFYIDKELGTGEDYSGALFLIDMGRRELTFSTSGKMIRYLPDSRLEAIYKDVIAYAAEGDYYGAASAFVKDVEICYDNKIAANQYNQDTETGKISRYRSIQWYEALFAFAVAIVCGFSACAAVVHDYGMKNQVSRMSANFKVSYRKDSAFRMGNILADVLLGSYITHRIIASAKNNGGGFGGGGGRGGGSFSGGGRSSTHSYGGRSFGGGGGRKF